MIRIQLSEVIYGRRHFGDVLDICKRELAGIVVPPYPVRALVPSIQAVAHETCLMALKPQVSDFTRHLDERGRAGNDINAGRITRQRADGRARGDHRR